MVYSCFSVCQTLICSRWHSYSPYPSGYPTQCVCNKPYIECNGKCGLYHACPSGYVKREAHFGRNNGCQPGLTACGIPGRNARTWECVNTETDLESCTSAFSRPTDLSDLTFPDHRWRLHHSPEFVSTRGRRLHCYPWRLRCFVHSRRCNVHRCMPGYEVSSIGDSCVCVEEKDPYVLASQYGLEHTPL